MLKCDICNKPATVHLTEIRNGKKIEKHLCEQCAAQNEGLPVKSHTPINELLTNFVMAHSGMQKDLGQACEACGITWAEFRQGGLFGCSNDYTAFEKDLTPLLERAHEGATHHVGKVPTRRGGAGGVPMKRQVDLSKLRKELQKAVEAEDYERAAKLRDQIKKQKSREKDDGGRVFHLHPDAMKLSDLTSHAGEWLRGSGPMSEVVISSRIRLARNVAGHHFLSKCSRAQRTSLEHKIRDVILDANIAPQTLYVDLDQAPQMDRDLLVERHLISKPHAAAEGARGVAIGENETISIMINEEDHLRIQVLRSGLQLEEAWEQINQLDDRLESKLDYSFHPRFGYLTACPTNVGTGIRVSVMLHLPALKLTGEIEKVFRAAKDMRLAVRGLYGEGTEATGDFYQISNQTTLGKSEEEIISDFKQSVIPKIIQYEEQARRTLLNDRTAALDDKVFRALGTLRFARLISSEDTLNFLSHLRLGINLGRVKDIDLRTINELFLLSQPAHLQKLHGKKLDGDLRRAARAEFIRQRLNGQ